MRLSLLGALIFPLISASLVACGMNAFEALPLAQNSATSSPSTDALETISLSSESFDVAYTGGGAVNYSANQLEFYPATTTLASNTHATLLLLKETVDKPVKDFELVIDFATTQQLRQGDAANAWEVFWLFFGYNGTSTDKTTNYYLSKPAPYGSEIGLASGTVTQSFLDTNSSYSTEVGARHVFIYKRKNSVFSVWRDGILIYQYVDLQQKLYSAKGAIGFYCEDARVQIYSVQFGNLD